MIFSKIFIEYYLWENFWNVAAKEMDPHSQWPPGRVITMTVPNTKTTIQSLFEFHFICSIIWNLFSADNQIFLIKILILLPCGQWLSHRSIPPTSRYATTHSGEDGVTTDIILIKLQLDAAVCSLIYFTAKSLYLFRVSTAPIIRNTKNCNRNLRYRSLYWYSYFPPTWPRWSEVAVPILWRVPEAAVTVFSTPDDGCGGHPKHVEWLCSKMNQTAYCCI